MPEAHLNSEPPPVATPSAGFGGGDLIACAGCGKRSDPSVRFCGGCGARMWQPCAACEAVNPVDQKFCGGCGVSLEQALDEAREKAEEAIRQAEAHAEQGRFSDAIRMLERLELPGHAALDELRQSAEQRVEEMTRRRDELTSSVGQILAEAKQLAEQGALRRALEAAKRSPPALRGAELRALHDELEEKIDELDRLRREVKEGLAKKEYGPVHTLVTRALELDPGDEKMRSLMAKLDSQRSKIDQSVGRKQLKTALAALKECNYRVAEAALAEAPEAEHDEKTRKAMASARERVWLANQLARAPCVDATLIAIADRLAKLQPHDEKVAKLREELSRRWKKELRKRPGQPIAWGKQAVEEDHLDALPIACEASFAKALAAKGHSPGQFMVAYGLAVQAAGGAAFPVDLAPKRRGWASRFALGKGRKRAAAAWGVDIGTHSIKAVRLTLPEEGPPVLDDFYIADTSPDGANAGESAGSLPAGAALAVHKLLQSHDLDGASVVVGMPSRLTLGRFFQLPWLSESKFEEAVRYEARMRIPLDPEDVCFDYAGREIEDEDLAGDADGAKLMRVTLVASNREHAAQRVALFADSGAAEVAVTSDGLALANAYAAQVGAPGPDEDDVAVVDIGAGSTSVVVVSAEGCWFRGLYTGGSSFDRRIVDALKCSWQNAEETRRKPSRAAWMHEVDAALAPGFEELGEHLERTLAQHRNEEGRGVGRVVLTGGAAEQYGLVRRLRTGL